MAIANGTWVSFCNQPKVYFGLLWVRPYYRTIAVNVTWMKRGFNACQTHLSSTVLRAIARYWSEIATFPTLLHLTPPLGCSHSQFSLEFREKVWSSENCNMGLPGAVKTFEDRLIRFDTIPARTDRVKDTDGQTSSTPVYSYNVSMTDSEAVPEVG